ncbi:MAG TPA: DUF748 domain-containing protein [Steroidobacteraceae bacterium]|nr:DUF748 domain-containing protein [Steroidobacteraceae bacterium]
MIRVHLSRAVRLTLIVLAVLILLYAALGFWLVPRLVRSNIVDFAHEQYHRSATLGEVRFNPFTLKLELRGFSLPDADGATLLAFERLLLNVDVSSVWRLGPSFADVELDAPFARVLLRPDGSLNLADLAHLANPAPPSKSERKPRVFIDRLSVSMGRVAFEDHTRSQPFATELRPITFELRDFSTAGESGNAYSLRGASLQGESFAWSGNFQLTPLASNGEFEVSGLKARTVWDYLRDALPFELSKGEINLDGEYFYSAAADGGLRLAVHGLALSDFGLRPAGGEQDYVEVGNLAIQETQVDLARRRVDIARVRLDGGTLRVARDEAGRINLAELARKSPAVAGQEEAPAQTQEPSSAPPWTLAAPDISVADLQVDFHDSLVKPGAEFSLMPVTLAVKGFSTAPDTRFTIESTARGEHAGELQLTAQTDAGGKNLEGHVEWQDLDLTALQPYLSAYTQITLNSGRLSTALDVKYAADGPFGVKGDVTVSKLATVDNTLRQDLLKWERITAAGIDFAAASGAAPARLQIARIDARAPYARLIIASDQTLNITQLFTPAAGSTPPAVQTVSVDESRRAPGGNPGGMRIGIGRISVQGGSANFADYWITPNYAVSLQELSGSIAGLSSDPKSRARVKLEGRVDRYAPALINGEINLLSAALYTDMHVKFDGVDMTSVTPYSGRFAGYEIEKGKLSIDVNYLVQDRQLTAKQKFVVDQLQLGARVESPDAVKLPLKLAVALLKDRNGVIDIDLPLSGSLDDPQFRIGPLIWKAFVGLLTRIATSPFTLLAKLGGRDDEINQLDFAAGSATLDQEGQERMRALAKALTERPSLALEVPTAYSPEADGTALAQARLDARLAAAGAQPGMDDAARFELLRKLYEKETDKAPLPAAALTVLEKRKSRDEEVPYRAGIEQLEATLREKQPANEAELGDLARARAQAIRDALLGAGDVDPARVFLLGIKPVAAAEGKVRVELALR